VTILNYLITPPNVFTTPIVLNALCSCSAIYRPRLRGRPQPDGPNGLILTISIIIIIIIYQPTYYLQLPSNATKNLYRCERLERLMALMARYEPARHVIS
jgi:hypothetical protein